MTSRLFYLTENEVTQILMAEDSDDDPILDEEDMLFLEEDMENLTEPQEVIIDSTNVVPNVDPEPEPRVNQKDIAFKWVKKFFVPHAFTEPVTEYSKVLIPSESQNVKLTLSSMQFRQHIARGLIGTFSSRQRQVPQSTVQTFKRRSQALNALKNAEHVLIKKEKRGRCCVCLRELDRKTPNFCSTCEKFFCFSSEKDCFSDYHMQV